MQPEKLKKYRSVLGLTQKQMAKDLKVSLSIYSKWESNHANIPDWVNDRAHSMVNSVSLSDLTPEEIKKLNARAKDSGKSTEQYIADLIKAAIGLIILACLLGGTALLALAFGEISEEPTAGAPQRYSEAWWEERKELARQ